jgi:hypothetical protein
MWCRAVHPAWQQTGESSSHCQCLPATACKLQACFICFVIEHSPATLKLVALVHAHVERDSKHLLGAEVIGLL